LQQSGFVKSPQVSHTKQAEGKRKVANEKDIQRAAEYDFNFISRKQKKHVKMVENSVKKLQDNIMTMMSDLPKKNGNLIGLKTSIKQAQKIHKDINKIFETEWSASTRKVIDDFQDASKMIEKSFSIVGESVTFTGLDKTSMKILGDGMWQDYLNVGTQKRDMVVQAMYDQIIAGGPYSNLINTIQAALQGSLSPAGRPLAQYARLFARDGIMNFSNQVTLKKAEEIGIKHFLYVGNIIATSRKFCKTRAGKVYTKKQIDGWKFKWSGKSGPAYTHRGGYNCRHHWRPVRPEWLEKGVKTKLDIGNWDLETKQPPLPKPKKKPKPPVKRRPLTRLEQVRAQVKRTNTELKNIENKLFTEHRILENVPKDASRIADNKTRLELHKKTDKVMTDLKTRFPVIADYESKQKFTTKGIGFTNGRHVRHTDIGHADPFEASGVSYGDDIMIGAKAGHGSKGELYFEVGSIDRHNVGFSYESILRHELGHFYMKKKKFFNHQVAKKWNSNNIDLFDGQVDPRAVQRAWKKRNKYDISVDVSEYASTSISEFWAEIFCAYTSPKYEMGMMPLDIENIFRNLGKPKKGGYTKKKIKHLGEEIQFWQQKVNKRIKTAGLSQSDQKNDSLIKRYKQRINKAKKHRKGLISS
jgi:hypothetical protein